MTPSGYIDTLQTSLARGQPGGVTAPCPLLETSAPGPAHTPRHHWSLQMCSDGVNARSPVALSSCADRAAELFVFVSGDVKLLAPPRVYLQM